MKTTPKTVFKYLVDSATEGNQHQFSKLINKSYAQINDWYSGRKNISLNSLLKIIEILESKNVVMDYNEMFKGK